jgi:hypothetical protein
MDAESSREPKGIEIEQQQGTHHSKGRRVALFYQSEFGLTRGFVNKRKMQAAHAWL